MISKESILFLGLQFWTNMKPYSDQVYGPTTLSYTIGITGTNTYFNQKISVHKLRPGFHTTIYVTPEILQASADFSGLDLKQRRCKLPHETDGLQLFKQYTRQGCEIECAAKKATSFCKCLPWNFPNNFTSYPLCDMFGGFCFNQIISNEVFYKKCKSQCLENCEDISLSVWQKTVPFDIKELCKPGTYFDKFFRKNFQRLFAFEQYRALVEEKFISSIDDSFTNDTLCTNYIRRYVSLVSIESPSDSIYKSSLDRRTSFSDQLGVIGGTLGICVGTSIFSFAEVIVLVYIIIKSLGQDLMTLWKKMKHFLQFVDSKVKKKVPLENVIVIRQHQDYNEQEVFQDNQQILLKLYVSTYSIKIKTMMHKAVSVAIKFKRK